MTEHHYHLNVFWSDDDNCWVADAPDLKYCSAFGDTAEKAVAEAQIAVTLFVESLKANGKPVPAPRYRPAIYAANAA